MTLELQNELPTISFDIGGYGWAETLENVAKNEGKLQPVIYHSPNGGGRESFFVTAFTEYGTRYLQFQEFSAPWLEDIFKKGYDNDEVEEIEMRGFRVKCKPKSVL